MITLSLLLFVLFLGLKLAEIIDWSWWLVTSPLWFSAIVSVIVYVIVGVGAWAIKTRRF